MTWHWVNSSVLSLYSMKDADIERKCKDKKDGWNMRGWNYLTRFFFVLHPSNTLCLSSEMEFHNKNKKAVFSLPLFLLSTWEFVCDLPGGSVKSVTTLQSTRFRIWDYGSVFLDREPLRDIQPMKSCPPAHKHHKQALSRAFCSLPSSDSQVLM